MRKILTVAVLAPGALAAYLLLWPVPVQPVAWQAPQAPGYVGLMHPTPDWPGCRRCRWAPTRVRNTSSCEMAGSTRP